MPITFNLGTEMSCQVVNHSRTGMSRRCYYDIAGKAAYISVCGICVKILSLHLLGETEESRGVSVMTGTKLDSTSVPHINTLSLR
jgi:hypothetical protein